MSVHADATGGADADPIPEGPLVPMDGAHWTSWTTICVSSTTTRERRRPASLAEAQVAVYNATRKSQWVHIGLPRVALLEAPQCLATRSARSGQVSRRARVDRRRVRDDEGAPWPFGAAPDEGDVGRFLIPVIDLINHHERGAPWARAATRLSISVARPTGDTQCFVRYRARQEPLDLALAYGFVDDSCTLARSVPRTVRWRVWARSRLPAAPSDRSALDPPTVVIEPDRLWLSHVTFDSGTRIGWRGRFGWPCRPSWRSQSASSGNGDTAATDGQARRGRARIATWGYGTKPGSIWTG